MDHEEKSAEGRFGRPHPHRALALGVCGMLLFGGCDAKRVIELEEENARLKAQLAALTAPPGPKTGVNGTERSAPARKLTIDQLWSERFDDSSRFRAQQRLDGKMLRVTGIIDKVEEGSISMEGGASTMGRVKLVCSLEGAYLNRVRDTLPMLENGRTITMEGKFMFEKMRLADAVVVDPVTGEPVSAEELAATLGSAGSGEAVP